MDITEFVAWCSACGADPQGALDRVIASSSAAARPASHGRMKRLPAVDRERNLGHGGGSGGSINISINMLSDVAHERRLATLKSVAVRRHERHARIVPTQPADVVHVSAAGNVHVSGTVNYDVRPVRMNSAMRSESSSKRVTRSWSSRSRYRRSVLREQSHPAFVDPEPLDVLLLGQPHYKNETSTT